MNQTKAVALLLCSVIVAVSARRVQGNWEHREDFQIAEDEALALPSSHEVIIAVKQLNLDRIENITLSVSDPSHSSYGEHLSYDEVHQMTSNPEALRAVQEYCAKNDIHITKTSSHGEYIHATATPASWERFLQAKFVTMRHVTKGTTVLRSREFTMPAPLLQHVSHIFSVVELPARPAITPQVKMIDEEPDNGYPCKSTMKMACWNYRYNQTTNDATGEHQMVFGQKGAYTQLSDLSMFASSNSIEAQSFNCPVASGCSETQCKGYDPDMKPNGPKCAEGNLDTQFISGVAQGATNTFYQNQNLDTPFLEFITYASSLKSPPSVMSISYGSYEYEMDHAVMDHFSTEAMKLGAQGVSILSASGDDGVAGYKARNDTSQCKYTTSFPTTCPWVTSVGATQNAENDPEDHEVHTLQEYAANAPEQQGPYFKVTTAGGFSNYFQRPDYQAAAVKAYFATPESARAAPGYNTTGRGVPDISSNSINFQTWINASPALICGSSGSAPSVAGMISVINAQRVKAGKARLGFLNPMVYKTPQAFNDIPHGWNNCSAVVTHCCKQGFTGASGWDPLVGMGSPSYIRLMKATGL